MVCISRTKEYQAIYWKKYMTKKGYKQKFCVLCEKKYKYTSCAQKRCQKCRFIKCQYCNKKFIPKNSTLKHKFCSSRCNALGHPEKILYLLTHRGKKPRTYHLRERPKHEGAEYTDWRLAVWKRDNFTCQHCNRTANELKKEKIKICADHIKPYCNYPKLRYNIDNGRTLCVPCHKKTETYGSKARKF